MQLKGRRFEPTSDPPRLTLGKTAAYVGAILLGLGILKALDTGILRSPFAPPPTPTRMAASYIAEGRAFFAAGILEKAIAAYQKAAAIEPDSAQLWAELARIQTYSSELMLSNAAKAERLWEAKASIDKAVCPADSFGELDPVERRTALQATKAAAATEFLATVFPTPLSPAEQRQRLQATNAAIDQIASCRTDYAEGYAIKTLVLDWLANPAWMDEETRGRMLNDAYLASTKALTLDSSNALALAFRAEVLVDQANWSTALDVGAQAAQRGPDSMDVHRAYAYVLESNGYYTRAVEEYLAAIRLNANLPFLYIRLGANYRKLGESTTSPDLAAQYIADALDAFNRAAELNPKDPIAFLSIAQTYANQGEFFAAERNAEKALSLDNTNPLLYGRLGVIYYKAKNYETAIQVLRCAVRGCAAADNEIGEVDVVETLPLAANSVDVYYIYGSVLSFYGNENDNCTEAAQIFALLRASPYHDDVIEAIIREGEVICASYTRKTSAAS
jgi:tetratricopeptide (TPR) repeat protein